MLNYFYIVEYYYDSDLDELIKSVTPACFEDGSFKFGQHMIPTDGATSLFHYGSALSSAKGVFKPVKGKKTLRSLMFPGDTFNTTDWKAFAKEKLEDTSMAYAIRVNRVSDVTSMIDKLIAVP